MAVERSDLRATRGPSSSADRHFFQARLWWAALWLTVIPVSAGWLASELSASTGLWALLLAASVLTQAALVSWLTRAHSRSLGTDARRLARPEKKAEAVGEIREAGDSPRPSPPPEEDHHSRSELLANMSHELRDPVNGILGASELLLKQELCEIQREYVEIVRSSSSGLLQVVEDILDYANVDAGKLVPEISDFSLSPLLQDVVGTMKPPAEARGLELRLEEARGLPLRVRGDRARLRQILLHLMDNAIRHTVQGHVILAVESLPATGRIEIGFAVRDTGVGLDAAARERLFSPFARGGTPDRSPRGAGLGLAISHRVVDLLGGSIEIDSTPGAGSTFFVSLPFELPKGTARPPAELPRRAASSRRAERVLIAEDEAVNRLIAVRLLEQLGYRAEAVCDGQAAIEALERGRYDLVLMDCQMPELDGYAATHLIRQQESEGQHIPIVAMTAHALRGDREKCLAAGMDDYLAKPFRQRELAAVLARWTSHRRQKSRSDALDPAMLATLLRLNHEAESDFLSRAIEDFLQTESPKLADMRRALRSDDTRHLMAAAHSLCGAAGSLGAFHLSKLCGELVDLAQYRTLNECRVRLRDVEREFERTVAELKTILGEPSHGGGGRHANRSA